MEEGQSIQPPSFPLSSHPLCLQISVTFAATFHKGCLQWLCPRPHCLLTLQLLKSDFFLHHSTNSQERTNTQTSIWYTVLTPILQILLANSEYTKLAPWPWPHWPRPADFYRAFWAALCPLPAPAPLHNLNAWVSQELALSSLLFLPTILELNISIPTTSVQFLRTRCPHLCYASTPVLRHSNPNTATYSASLLEWFRLIMAALWLPFLFSPSSSSFLSICRAGHYCIPWVEYKPFCLMRKTTITWWFSVRTSPWGAASSSPGHWARHADCWALLNVWPLSCSLPLKLRTLFSCYPVSS